MANLQYDVSVSEVAGLLGLVILSIRNEDQQWLNLQSDWFPFPAFFFLWNPKYRLEIVLYEPVLSTSACQISYVSLCHKFS